MFERRMVTGKIAALPGRGCDDVAYLIKQIGLDGNVVQTGWLSTEEVISSMLAADILVVPKTYDIANQAGVATKMVEYLSMGRAVVATRVGDVPLYLHDGADSLLCAPGNQAELTDALRRLLHEFELREALGVRARRKAYQYFDYRTAGQQMEHAMLRISAVADQGVVQR